MSWFHLTHALAGGFGWVMWQRISLPGAGGLEDQDGRLMEALALIAREQNALLVPKDTKRTGRRRDRQPRG